MSTHTTNKRASALAMLACLALVLSGPAQAGIGKRANENAEKNPNDWVQVIVSYEESPDAEDDDHVIRNKGQIKRRFSIIDAHAISIPGQALKGLLHNPNVKHVSLDEPVIATGSTLDEGSPANITLEATPTGIQTPDYSYPTNPTFAFPELNNLHMYGTNGSGIGVAVIDSGFTAHADLTPALTMSFIPGTAIRMMPTATATT